jgi:hypothetical protein
MGCSTLLFFIYGVFNNAFLYTGCSTMLKCTNIVHKMEFSKEESTVA